MAKKRYFIVVGIHRTVIIRVSKVIGQPTWPPVHKVKEVKNQPNILFFSLFTWCHLYNFFIFYLYVFKFMQKKNRKNAPKSLLESLKKCWRDFFLFYKFHNEIFILFFIKTFKKNCYYFLYCPGPLNKSDSNVTCFLLFLFKQNYLSIVPRNKNGYSGILFLCVLISFVQIRMLQGS